MTTDAQPLGASEAFLATALLGSSIFDLASQVRTGGVIHDPQHVCVVGPTNWRLAVTVNRRGDVTHHPYNMTADTELLPAAWFLKGDLVQIERTVPFEPVPVVPTDTPRSSWLGGEAGQGVGDYINRRR
jgi:hypothetical protein